MGAEQWTALATVVIAVFTVVLAVVGVLQAWLTRSTINLARNEFAVAYPPQLIVHSVQSLTGDEGGGGVQITYLNKGRADARIVEISGSLFRVNGEGLPAGLDLSRIATFVGIVEGGKEDYFVIPEESLTVVAVAGQRLFVDKRYCIGHVIYKGPTGRAYRTGFCRIEVNGEWQKVDNPEYEYGY
jgi:hypothetical protein